jgi:CMP-N-acetylneuraminic acid synthetase
MSNTVQSLAIIPARGGSKRFPGKNKAILGGKPLIYHSIQLAVENFTTVIFSSNCPELRSIASQLKLSNLIIQDQPTASNTSQVIECVKEIYEERANDGFDEIWMLLPTCPLRSHSDIVKCKNLLRSEANFVVSITDFDFPPSLSLNITNNGHIQSTCPSQPWERKHHRSQNHRKCYRPNGAIYGAKYWAFKENDFNFYSESDTVGYYMPKERSIDIDTKFDLKIAELVINENNNHSK